MDRRDYSPRISDREDSLQDFVRTIAKNQQPFKKEQIIKPLGKTNCYVIGVGGGGNNTINRLMSTGIKDATCLCINTDLQHLNSVACDATLLIGKKTTRGLGSGGKPERGRAAAEESRNEIKRTISDADIIFLTCGLGGGTGTGAMPLIAELAKEAGAIVISVVTMPFTIEGNRKAIAAKGLEELRKYSDTLVIIENDTLLDIVPDVPIEEAFSVADEVLANYIYSIITTVTQPGLISVDFADLKSIITKGGVTVCGVGEARGEGRVAKAVQKALESPLITVNYKTGSAALINVIGGSTMTLKEASSVVDIIRKQIQPDAEIIWGTKVDHELGDILRITVVISGVESEQITGRHSKRALSSLQGPPYDIVAGNATLPLSEQKENWLNSSERPTLRDLRKKLEAKEQKERAKYIREKEETTDFWDELGISKGLD
ncbi:MAG: cell division protein FtsZ [Candidatus Heimdallarchaeota archaeon]